MKTISKNDWRYKIIAAMFTTKSGWMPTTSCQFHFYTLMAVLAWPFVVIPELVLAIAVNEFDDLKEVIKNATQVCKPVNRWATIQRNGLVFIFFYGVGIIIVDVLTPKGFSPIALSLLSLPLMFAVAFLGMCFCKVKKILKKFCAPINYLD
jgi:hypothetical protein